MIIKKLYLDPFLDMFNGEILSYGISKNPSAISVLSAQKKAIEITADCPIGEPFILIEDGHIKCLRTLENYKKTKSFIVCLGKVIVMIIM